MLREWPNVHFHTTQPWIKEIAHHGDTVASLFGHDWFVSSRRVGLLGSNDYTCLVNTLPSFYSTKEIVLYANGCQRRVAASLCCVVLCCVVLPKPNKLHRRVGRVSVAKVVEELSWSHEWELVHGFKKQEVTRGSYMLWQRFLADSLYNSRLSVNSLIQATRDPSSLSQPSMSTFFSDIIAPQ
jgi:hypothetical protein